MFLDVYGPGALSTQHRRQIFDSAARGLEVTAPFTVYTALFSARSPSSDLAMPGETIDRMQHLSEYVHTNYGGGNDVAQSNSTLLLEIIYAIPAFGHGNADLRYEPSRLSSTDQA